MVSCPGQHRCRPCQCKVYNSVGRAVFSSCPLGCAGDSVLLSVIERESAKFNATITHTPGGSCGFKQEITRVLLMKINDQFGVDDEQLLSCPTSQTTLCSNSKVSLDRGRDPGYEFVFTLSNAVDDDAGPYEVIVEVKHPSTGSITQLKKRFNLNINGKRLDYVIQIIILMMFCLLWNSSTHNHHWHSTHSHQWHTHDHHWHTHIHLWSYSWKRLQHSLIKPNQ